MERVLSLQKLSEASYAEIEELDSNWSLVCSGDSAGCSSVSISGCGGKTRAW